MARVIGSSVNRIKITLVILFLCLALGISGCSLLYRGQTITVEPFDPNDVVASPNLIYLSMHTANEGWGLTENQVVKTVDGGSDWGDVTPEGAASIGYRAGKFFMDAATGWVLIPESENSEEGKLFYTSDSGNTWSFHKVPFGNANLFFLDNRYGWALFNTGAGAGSSTAQILRTENGGETWSLVYEVTPDSALEATGIPFSGSKEEISFRDENHGYVSGNIPADGFVYLYETMDGGASWSQVSLELPQELQKSMLSFQAPQFFDAERGKLVVRYFGTDNQGTLLFTTNDGGDLWVATTPIPSLGSVAVENMQSAMIWDGEMLYWTNDGGVTWRSDQTNILIRDTLAQLNYPAKNTGYALSIQSDGESTLYTTQGNVFNWREIP